MNHTSTNQGPIEPSTLRRTMGKFATGVAVVTAGTRADPHGMTVNSLTSVSLDPPLILVSLMPDARTAQVILEQHRFAVSILSVRQEAIALRFSRQGEDHFAGLPLEYGDHDVPVVPGAVAHVECQLEQPVEAGDHVLLLGRAVRTCEREGEPLAFYSGRFGEFLGGKSAETWFF